MAKSYYILINIYNETLISKLDRYIGSWKYILYRDGEIIREDHSIEFNFSNIRLCLTAYWKALKQIDNADDIFVFAGCNDLAINNLDPKIRIAPEIAHKAIERELKRINCDVLVISKREIETNFKRDNLKSYKECKQIVMDWKRTIKKNLKK